MEADTKSSGTERTLTSQAGGGQAHLRSDSHRLWGLRGRRGLPWVLRLWGVSFIGEGGGGGCSSPVWVPHASLDTGAMSHPSAENAHQQPCEVSCVRCGSSDGACVGSSPRDTELGGGRPVAVGQFSEEGSCRPALSPGRGEASSELHLKSNPDPRQPALLGQGIESLLGLDRHSEAPLKPREHCS